MDSYKKVTFTHTDTVLSLYLRKKYYFNCYINSIS